MNGIIHFLTHVLTQYVPLVIFMAVLLKQVGLPVPAIPFLIASGLLVGSGQLLFGVAVGLAILAVLLGNQVWYHLDRQFKLREIHLDSDMSDAPQARVVDHRMPPYFLNNGMGAFLWASSAIGLGYVFSDRLEEAVSAVPILGLMTALALLGTVAGYAIYGRLPHVGTRRLMSMLTMDQVTKRISARKAPLFISLPLQGTRQDAPGSLALSAVLSPGVRSRRRRKPG